MSSNLVNNGFLGFFFFYFFLLLFSIFHNISTMTLGNFCNQNFIKGNENEFKWDKCSNLPWSSFTSWPPYASLVPLPRVTPACQRDWGWGCCSLQLLGGALSPDSIPMTWCSQNSWFQATHVMPLHVGWEETHHYIVSLPYTPLDVNSSRLNSKEHAQ